MASPKLTIVVGADISQAEKNMKKISSRLSKMSKNLISVGSSLTKMTAALTAWGGGAVAASLKLEDCFKTIRAGTGATGDALKGLVDDFKAVGAKTSAPLESVASAVADLNTRLGISGEPLREMVMNVSEAARMTGEDMKSLANEAAKAMTDAGISAENGAAFMDKLFLASQNTGLGMTQLATKMYKFGTPLRAMGFELNETIALLSSFDKAGVNTDLVMGSLRQALGKMAKSGETDLSGALRRTIQSIKDAGNAGTATSIAIEMFGQKAGPDMAGAIREGRFEVDALIQTLMKSQGTIQENAAATDGFTEKWKKVKDQLTLSLQPLGDSIIRLSNKYILPLAETISQMSSHFSDWAVIAGACAVALGPLCMALGTVMSALTSAAASIYGGWLALKKFTLVTMATKGAVAALTADMTLSAAAAKTTAASMVFASSTAVKLRFALTGLKSVLASPATGLIALIGAAAAAWGWAYIKQSEKAQEKTERISAAVCDLNAQIENFSAAQLENELKKVSAVLDEINAKLAENEKRLKAHTLPTSGMAVGAIGQIVGEGNRLRDSADVEKAKEEVLKKALEKANAALPAASQSKPQAETKTAALSPSVSVKKPSIADRIGRMQDEIKYLGADPASYLAELETMYSRIPEALSDDKKKIMDMQNEIIDAVSAQQDEAAQKVKEQTAVIVAAAGKSLESLRKEYEGGRMYADEYVKGIAAISSEYGQFPAVLEEAEKALDSFNEAQAAKIPTIISQVSSSMDTMKTSLAEIPSKLGDAFASAIAKGEDLRSTLASLLQDIGYVIVKALFMRTLFGSSGNSGLLGGLFGGLLASAKGNVFAPSGVVPFAQGGVVSSPTLFRFARGTGLMGEAGPEAIMPLERDSRGRLGVHATGEGAGGGVYAPQFIVTVNNSGSGDMSDEQAAKMSRALRDAVDARVAENLYNYRRMGYAF